MRRAFTFADGAKRSYIVPKISSTLIVDGQRSIKRYREQ
jgi:hypothetical protein